MDISIIICTYNRAQILEKTLASYSSLKPSDIFQVELLIVDNNSNDNTAQIINTFIKQHPETRYIFEPNPGLSHARNTGIKESKGNIIAFIDDDVYLDPDWVTEVLHIFQDHPEASCMGGKSIPQFEIERPEWLTDQLLIPYGSTNSGDNIKTMLYPEHPFGLNMAFKREVFTQVGMFNPSLGRKKKNLLSNEESELFWRINQAGLNVIYAPKALLYHRIPAERTCKEWVLSRYYWQGISSIVFEQLIAPRSRLALLHESFSEAWHLVLQFTGKQWLPRKVYWHYNDMSFDHKRAQAVKLGKIKQLFAEALTYNKYHRNI